MNVVGLGGGIGASRLWRILAPYIGAQQLSIIVNTGEDLWQYGVRICPDLDTTLYALSDRQDLDRGWGLKNETFITMDAIRELGHDVWFNLGDQDLATHFLRTGWLREGIGLADVTKRLATSMGVEANVLPMSNDEVTTTVFTDDGRDLHYEEFLVREACRPRPLAVTYAGVENATPAPGVLAAIANADVIVIAPSNPVASIDPILAVPGIRAALRARSDDVIAISPIVARVPIEHPGEARRADSRARLLQMQGSAATPTAVAQRYAALCSRFVVDTSDAVEAEGIAQLGITPIVAPLLVHQRADPRALLEAVTASHTAKAIA